MAKKKTMRHASALKAKRQNVARKADNFQVRSKVRTLTNSVMKAISEKNLDQAKTQFKKAQSAWRKSAKSNIFHINTASRQIARMASRLSKLAKG